MAKKEKTEPPRKRCGAKARQRGGAPCLNWAMKGKNRCRFHGGKSTGAPKGSQNARTHGIYAKGISKAEKEIWHDIPIDNCDDEIRMCKIRIARYLRYEHEIDLDPENITTGMVVTEMDKQFSINEDGKKGGKKGDKGDGSSQRTFSSIKKKRTDFPDALSKLLGRLAMLMRANAEAKRPDAHQIDLGISQAAAESEAAPTVTVVINTKEPKGQNGAKPDTGAS